MTDHPSKLQNVQPLAQPADGLAPGLTMRVTSTANGGPSMVQMTTCDLHNETIARLERELAAMTQAVGLATTIKGEMVMRPDDPIGMMQEVVEGVAQQRRELAAANARVEEYRKDAERTRAGLGFLLDQIPINSENIGDIRGALLLPIECNWNAVVRDETAARENQPPRYLDDVDAAIDAAIAAKETP